MIFRGKRMAKKARSETAVHMMNYHQAENAHSVYTLYYFVMTTYQSPEAERCSSTGYYVNVYIYI
jgi:hypothetical protein